MGCRRKVDPRPTSLRMLSNNLWEVQRQSWTPAPQAEDHLPFPGIKHWTSPTPLKIFSGSPPPCNHIRLMQNQPPPLLTTPGLQSSQTVPQAFAML